MQRRLVLEFTKMHGAGNDFIVLDNRFYYFSDRELSDLAIRFCKRRYGVGADGLLALNEPTDPEADLDYRMRYFNADGSIGSMCGNGARCLGRFASMSGIEGEDYRFESDAGIYAIHVPRSSEAPVRLYPRPPRDFIPEVRLLDAQDLPEWLKPIHGIWPGVPHAVCFVDRTDTVPVTRFGPKLRYDRAFPEGASANFVELISKAKDDQPVRLKVRTYERGVEDETHACGTGAMASAFIARLTGRIDTNVVDVEMRGGTLRIGFELDNGKITAPYLEGPATYVFRGTVEV